MSWDDDLLTRELLLAAVTGQSSFPPAALLARAVSRWISQDQSVLVVEATGRRSGLLHYFDGAETESQHSLDIRLSQFLSERGCRSLIGSSALQVGIAREFAGDQVQLRRLPTRPAFAMWAGGKSDSVRGDQFDGEKADVDSPSNDWWPLLSDVFGRLTPSAAGFPQGPVLQAMAEFSAGAGHEINNPLGSILAQSQLLLKKTGDIGVIEGVELIGAQANRIRDMISDTMLFARPPEMVPEPCSLTDIAKDILASFRPRMQQAGISGRLLASEPQVVRADPSAMRTLLTHAVRNALESVEAAALPRGAHENAAGGWLEIGIESDEAGVEIVVRDSGGGFTEGPVREFAFSPYYSGRSAGRGLGFGLSHIHQIVQSHDGILVWENTADATELAIALPL